MTALLVSPVSFKPKPRREGSSHGLAREASPTSLERASALPGEIAFLASYGIAPAVLIEAGALSRRLGVAPAKALLSQGQVTDLVYYSALARRLGVPFVATLPTLCETPSHSLLAGAPIAPLPGGQRYLIAPEGDSLTSLLSLWRDGRAPVERMAITTPRRLAAWTRAANARAVAREACDELRRFDPALSAGTPLAASVFAALCVGAALGCGAVLTGGLVWLVLSGALWLASAGVVVLRLAATMASFAPAAPRPPPLSDARLPTYTVIAPLYREAGMAARLAASIKALDYPASKVEVKFVVEVDDHETRVAIEALDLPSRFEMIIAPAGAPRTKPRALNVALPTARGQLVVVFDAEDSPDPRQLRLAAERFAASDARLACLQARLVIDNTGDSWLAALFGIEYAALFDVVNPGLAALRAPMMLGGTSNHFSGIR